MTSIADTRVIDLEILQYNSCGVVRVINTLFFPTYSYLNMSSLNELFKGLDSDFVGVDKVVFIVVMIGRFPDLIMLL